MRAVLNKEAMERGHEGDQGTAKTERARRDGNLAWFWLEFSVFDGVRGRDDFQTIVRAVDDKVNASAQSWDGTWWSERVVVPGGIEPPASSGSEHASACAKGSIKA